MNRIVPQIGRGRWCHSPSGELVVFRGTRVPNREGEVCCCDDPSTYGATVDEVERTRFCSSFSGRTLIFKKCWSLAEAAFSYRG